MGTIIRTAPAGARAPEAARMLEALSEVDFGWFDRDSSVWEDRGRDVLDIHKGTLAALDQRLTALDRSRDQGARGSVVIGAAGSGKTHLLGVLRRHVWARGGYFILIDLTGVRDFAGTAVLGFLRALDHQLPDGLAQHQSVLERLATTYVSAASGDIIKDIRDLRDSASARAVLDSLQRGMAQRLRPQLFEHLDVLRALVFYSLGGFEDADVAYNWLQGVEVPEAVPQLGVKQTSRSPEQIIAGLSWLMSLAGPCIVGVDQLDAIVAAYHTLAQGNPDEEDASRARSIIDGVSVGLMDLIRGRVSRTLVTVCCIEGTWAHLQNNALRSVTDSFDPALLWLEGLPAGAAARQLIEQRLAPAFAAADATPPYPSWPFRPEAFDDVAGWSPRQLLMRSDAHVKHCLAEGAARELTGFDQAGTGAAVDEKGLDALEEAFTRLKAEADVAALRLTDERDEAPMRRLLSGLGGLLALQDGGHGDIDIQLEQATDPRRPALHLRLKHVHRAEGDREEVFAFRFLPHHNALSFQARLKAAVTQSGIERTLKFRHLVLLRVGAVPSGRRTSELMEGFFKAGGRLLEPQEDDLRALLALSAMEKARMEGFRDWLARRRPLDRLALARQAEEAWPRLSAMAPPSLTRDEPAREAPREALREAPREAPHVVPLDPAWATARPTALDDAREQRGVPGAARPPRAPVQASVIEPVAPSVPEVAPATIPSVASAEDDRPTAPAITARPVDAMPLGRVSARPEETFLLPLALLRKHMAIIAGAGSGKTVLLRRIIEEAARRDVPAIIIDTNNDLALLGSRWPARPASFADADLQGAEDYFARAEVVVWTPGLRAGNPLSLAPLPDFSALQGDGEELEGAVALACATLEEFVASGRGRVDLIRRGVLHSAMRAFASRSAGGLEDFITFLSDLPDEAGAGISRAPQHAAQMADSLRAAIARNPLMACEGTPLDPQRLITAARPGRVRVSVINLSGLPSPEAQQEFVNRLAFALFTFVRAHPPKAGQVLKALLAIDEAHQFAPASRGTPSRESLISLTKQARKYGLGMLFATQMPKDLHHGITNNCATQIFGKASSPAALSTIEGLMQARGRAPGDIARLATGTFYVCADTARPEKVVTPLCLSHHPASPPDPRGIAALAAESARAESPR